MSVRREDIINSEWVDSEELLPFSADGKLLALWSRTNEHSTIAGLYKVGAAAIRFETGLSPKRLLRALEELQRADYLRYDEPLLWVPSRAGRLAGVSPNMAKSMVRSLTQIGPHPYRLEFVKLYHRQNWFQKDDELVALYERDSSTLAGRSDEGKRTYWEQGTGNRGQDAA